MASVDCAGENESDAAEAASTEHAQKRPETDDLFHPAGAPIENFPATLAGLDHWERYESPEGLTIIGVSASGKRKVVMVVPTSSGNGGVKVAGAGYVTASDFHPFGGAAEDRDVRRELHSFFEALAVDVRAAHAELTSEPRAIHLQAWTRRECQLAWIAGALVVGAVLLSPPVITSVITEIALAPMAGGIVLGLTTDFFCGDS